MKTLLKLTLLLFVLNLFQSCSKDDAPTPEPIAQPNPEPEVENNAPTIAAQTFEVAENITDNMPIGEVVANDADTDVLTFSISANDSNLFEINETGGLSLNDLQTLDFETAQSHAITVAVTDGSTSTKAEITINVTDIDDTSFATTWQTTTANETVTIPTRTDEYDYDYTIDWGDGTTETARTGDVTHSYATAGIHMISISGEFPAINLGVGDFVPTPEIAKSREQIRTIERWGITEWKTMEFAFTLANTLTVNANDVPDFSQLNNLEYMFFAIDNLNGNFNHWDVANINNMENMFANSSFNQDISSWNVSNVTNMENMFSSTSFNQDIGAWDVSNVTNMRAMFFGSPFNQDISTWDVSNATDISFLFASSPFNQDISTWDVSNVTTMGFLFRGSTFNQEIGTWDVSNVTDMGSMFSGSSFNQDISNWDVGNVTTMLRMFQDSQFNQDISEWNVGKVNSMFGMFKGSSYNKDISNWDVSNVTIMLIMFEDSSFNQDISTWNVSKVTDMRSMFKEALFNRDISDWNVANVTKCEDFSLNAMLISSNTPNFTNCTF